MACRSGSNRIEFNCLEHPLRVSGLWVMSLVLVLGACSPGEADLDLRGWEPLIAVANPIDDSVGVLAWPTSGLNVAFLQLLLAGEGVETTSVGPPDGTALSLGWHAAGEQLLLEYSPELGSSTPSRFAVLDRSGTVVGEIVPSVEGSGGFGVLAVEPGGDYFVWSAQAPGETDEPADLWKVDLESGEAQRLTDTGGVAERWPRFVDSEIIVYLAGIATFEFGRDNGWIEALDLESGEKRRMTPEDQVVLSLDVDPTGRWVIYSAYSGDDRSQTAIWYVDARNVDEPRLLVERAVQRVSTSHDGRRILIQRAGGRPGDVGSVTWVDVPDDAPWLAISR